MLQARIGSASNGTRFACAGSHHASRAAPPWLNSRLCRRTSPSARGLRQFGRRKNLFGGFCKSATRPHWSSSAGSRSTCCQSCRGRRARRAGALAPCQAREDEDVWMHSHTPASVGEHASVGNHAPQVAIAHDGEPAQRRAVRAVRAMKGVRGTLLIGCVRCALHRGADASRHKLRVLAHARDGAERAHSGHEHVARNGRGSPNQSKAPRPRCLATCRMADAAEAPASAPAAPSVPPPPAADSAAAAAAPAPHKARARATAPRRLAVRCWNARRCVAVPR